MITHTLAAELDAIAQALPDFAAPKLNVYQQQTGKNRHAPALVILAQPQKIHGLRAAVVRVSLTIESNAGDEGEPPNNHAARVALVHRLFLEEKAARIAEISARGKLRVTDWGQLPGVLESGGDDTGEKLRSTLVLLVSARLPV